MNTEFGTFHVCAACADGCLSDRPAVPVDAPMPPGHIRRGADRRKFICRYCTSVLQPGDPPAALGVCDTCHEAQTRRRQTIAEHKADALATQHLEVFVLAHDTHPEAFGPEDLQAVAGKIGRAWDAEFRAVLAGRDDGLWGMA